MTRALSVLGAVAACAIAVTAAEPKPFRYVCQDAGAGGYESFPDVCRLRDGRILCVFYAGFDHVSLPKDPWPRGGRIAASISTDEGLTWGPARTLIDTPLDDRDPSVTVLKDGRMVCSFFTYEGPGRFATQLSWSTDGGATWSEPRPLADRYAVSSPVRELADGRLVLGLYTEEPGSGSAQGAVIWSDDKGASWSSPARIDNAGVRLDAETDIVQLKDGRLLAAQRGANGVPMHFSHSADRGATWTRSVAAPFEGHCPYLHRLRDGGLVLAVREMGPGPMRGGTTLRISRDEGKTWGAPVLVDAKGGSYPSLLDLRDGSVLVVYYEDKAAKADVRSRRFKVEDGTVRF